MPTVKEVPFLLNLSLDSLHHVIREEALRVAQVVATKFVYAELRGTAEFDDEKREKLAEDREIYLSEQVDAFKKHFIGHVPPNLIEQVMDPIISGISQALYAKKQEWSPMTNMYKFTKTMGAIIKFSNLVVIPTRKVLDLENLPKMIRTKLYNSLSIFKDLRTLILGSGSGGWLADVYSEKFAVGLPYMKNLVHLSLKYDCNSYFLHTLTETCKETLRILDIEFSKQVQDDSVNYIKEFQNLLKINMFRTGLSTQGQCEVLLGLPYLKHLDRGDFLADAIEHLEEFEDKMGYKIGEKTPVALPSVTSLKVQEFWASEEYFFHSEEQMALVSKYCPDIRTMLFMFDKTVCQLDVLASFPNLEDLDLWGGAFYSDGLCDLLEQIGHRLKKLSLVHIEEVDAKALAIITVTCPNLVHLGLHNSDFEELSEENNEEVVDPFRNADRILRAEKYRSVQKLVSPLLDLELVRIHSVCSEHYLTFLLQQCINVKEISLGMMTEISDKVWSDVLAKNSLQKLEKISCQKCTKVTIHGIELLLANCDNLRLIMDICYFEGISDQERQMLMKRTQEQNLNIAFEEKIKTYMDMDLEGGNFMKEKLKAMYPAIPDFDNDAAWGQGEAWNTENQAWKDQRDYTG